MSGANRVCIAIDGPAGSGKSTSARALANKLGYVFIDTGAMYRSVALTALETKTDPNDEAKVVEITTSLKIELFPDPTSTVIFVNGADRSNDIRDPKVSAQVSKVASYPGVRETLVQKQRELGQKGGVVMDGRDIGTVVFPNAELKIFMKADPTERAKRRCKELEASGKPAPLQEVLDAMLARDKTDEERATGPLKMADDAILLDTTFMSPEQVLEKLEELAREAEAKVRK